MVPKLCSLKPLNFLMTGVLTVANLSCSDGDSPKVQPDSGSEDSSVSDLSEALYDPGHIVDVSITIDPGDWDLVRNEGRKMTQVMSGCAPDFEYTWVKGTVTVDGKTYNDVGVRKKGYLGSLSQIRPALKVDFNRYIKGQSAWGVNSLTLNNDKQDRSHTHQCMTYRLFKAAGSPAPRCNFARVTVNGQDLGIYSNVESLNKSFLGRRFKNAEGNLYEGQSADFNAGMIEKFQLKTNEKKGDRSDLDRVVEAMAVDDTQLYASLETVIDMDAFLTFWAMELITGHWDSYSGDQNNFFTYHDPQSDKFYFIPWGTDGAFSTAHGFLPEDIPKSVYAWSWPTYRLYSIPNARARYQERLRSLLDKVWDEESLLTEVDRIGELTGAADSSLEQQRQYIRDRKQSVLDELDHGAPDWVYTPKTDVSRYSICIPTFSIAGQFDTTWGDLTSGLFSRPSDASPSGFEIQAGDTRTWLSYDLHVDEISQPFSSFLASAGAAKGDRRNVQPGTPQVMIVGLPRSTGPMVVVVLMFESQFFGAKEISFYAFENFGVVVRSTGSDSADDVILGYISDGKVVFDQVGQQPDDRVKGSFTGVFVPSIFDQLRY